ncbi:MAG: DNA cytosine methyltransferase [Blastocatellia bacterium]|nr:DNA cytosine methyltransferase [Blastocatellia bacterium]MBN8723778.1 DNA cytosine methyltransferase [Acidobacteriota bacterium]
MRTIDLFAGCGGMSLGFQNAGLQIVAAFDNWQPAINTYTKNFTHSIYNYDLEKYEPLCSIFKNLSPEIIIGGPPCQDFSSAGKRDETLGRANLTISFAEIVSKVKPKWFVMENVSRAEKSLTLIKAKEILIKADYGLSQIILDASLCGVPQERKRLFLIGQLNGQDNQLIPYLNNYLAPNPLTIRDYLGSKIDIEYYYRHPRSYKRRGVFSIDEPSPTIRGVNRPIPKGYLGHPGDPIKEINGLRPLTTKERSLIQTFPENFVFIGNKSEIEQLIGNAVPVKLAEYVARCIAEFSNIKTQYLQNLTKKPLQLSLF